MFGVAPGILIDLRLIVEQTEFVAYAARIHLNHGLHAFVEVFARQFEAMVPNRILGGAHLLALLPIPDSHVLPHAAEYFLVIDRGLPGNGWMHVPRVGDNHSMPAMGVHEIVVDSLFLHQPAHEIEVRFAVLDTIIAGVVGSVPVHSWSTWWSESSRFRMSGTETC